MRRTTLPLAVVLLAAVGCGPPPSVSTTVTDPTTTTPPSTPATTPGDPSAVQKVREAMTSSNNLKQIAIGMHNHESAFGKLPPAAIRDNKGKKLLSWRVAVLPYIEQENLYRQFKLDEPWDSDHNKKLIEQMPKTYADARAGGSAKPGETYYKVFVGKNAGFEWEKGRTVVSVTDGTSNTIMVAAGGDPVTWTKPDDFECDPTDTKTPMPDLARPFDRLLVAMFDGSVKLIDLKTLKDSDKNLRAAITPDGGEVVFLDDPPPSPKPLPPNTSPTRPSGPGK